LVDPVSVRTARPNTLVADASIVDLLTCLRAKGWSIKQCSKKRRGVYTPPPPINVRSGLPKVIWVRNQPRLEDLAVSRFYLIALLSLDKVKPPSMEHLQTDAYYKDLVRGNAVHVAPKTKLQPDMGDGVGEGLG
jgi:hypothetical protein